MTINTLTLLDTGEKIDFISASISGNLDNFAYSAEFVLADYQVYNRIKPKPPLYIPAELNLYGITFVLIIENGSRSWSVDDNGARTENFNLTARSPTALLDHPHSMPINALVNSLVWENTSAKTITQQLCDSQNIPLIWSVPDWPIRVFSVSNTVPIDAIIQLVSEKGIMAIVQPTPDGKLHVCFRDKISPNKYQQNLPDYVITDDDNLFSLSESYVERGKYQWIQIANEAINTQVAINFEIVDDVGSVIIKAFVVPFKAIELQQAGLSFVHAVYEGIFTEEVIEDVTLIDGIGKVSKPFYNLVSVQYFYQNLGDLLITEEGNITADSVGHSLATVTYRTKYHRYRATPKAAKKTLAYTETL